MIGYSIFSHSILTANSNDPLLAAIVGFFAGLVFFYKGFKELLLKRVIENTPTSKIRSMAMGLVEIVGKAKPRKTIISPISKKECTYYQWKIEKYARNKNSGRWVKIGGGESYEPFYIEDNTGKAIVFPIGADFKLKTDMQIKCNSYGIKPEWAMLFDSKGIKYRGFFGSNRLRITEIYVLPDDVLYILGTAHFWKSKKKDTFMMNTEKKEVMERLYEMDSKCHASLRKGKNSKYYLISDSSEKELISRMSWQVPLMLFGGPLLSVAMLIYILYRFHSL